MKLRHLLPAEHREWLRSAARGNPYRREAGIEPVRIGEIVSPLRYDITVRAQHFALYAECRELFAADFEAYQRLAREQDYFIWFGRVMAPRWLPGVLEDPVLFENAWRERLRASAALYDSFEARGFDSAHPIELYAGYRVRDAAGGRRATRGLFAGDGNHRLALLMAAGQSVLLPGQYRVKRYLSLVPIDTTRRLLRETGAGWAEYRSFIELGYPSARLDAAEGRVLVEAAEPSVAAEVTATVERDLPHLTGEIA